MLIIISYTWPISSQNTEAIEIWEMICTIQPSVVQKINVSLWGLQSKAEGAQLDCQHWEETQGSAQD